MFDISMFLVIYNYLCIYYVFVNNMFIYLLLYMTYFYIFYLCLYLLFFICVYLYCGVV